MPGRELALANSQGRTEDHAWRLRRDGCRFWREVTIAAVRDSSGALLRFAKVTNDTTERVRLARLEHANTVARADSARTPHRPCVVNRFPDGYCGVVNGYGMVETTLKLTQKSGHLSFGDGGADYGQASYPVPGESPATED
jgi:hypothetical protein